MAKIKTKKIMLEDILVLVEEQPYKVPKNWCWIHWGDAGEFIAGSGFKNQYQGYNDYDIPFYKVGSLKYTDINGYLYDNTNTINEDMRAELKATLIPVNSVLFAKIGEAIRLNRRSLNSVPCCIDNNMMAFFAQKCDCKYAFYWSRGLDLYNYTNATTVPAIRKSDLEKIPFPLPPMLEQQRIVERIENLYSKLDEAKDKAKEVVDGFDSRRAAILAQAFSGKLTEKWRRENKYSLDDWKETTLSEVVSGFKYGSSEKSTYENDGMPVLRIPNIGDGVIDFSDMKFLAHNDVDRDNQVHEDDLLIIRSNGSRDLVGKCAIVPELERDYAYASFLIRIKPSEVILPRFLLLYMNSSVARNQMFIKAKSSSGIHNINSKELGAIKIKVPSLVEQSEIVRILDEILAKENETRILAETVVDKIEEIKESVLAKAFRGELGTHDSSEASALDELKNILSKEERPMPKAKSERIPKNILNMLETETEKKIVRYIITNDRAVSLEDISGVASDTFEIIENVSSLEKKQVIKKLKNGLYRMIDENAN